MPPLPPPPPPVATALYIHLEYILKQFLLSISKETIQTNTSKLLSENSFFTISLPETLFKTILNSYIHCLKGIPFPHFAWPDNDKLIVL